MYPHDQVHLWIGTSHAPEAEYLVYFEIDYGQEAEVGDPCYRPCGFCLDLGVQWYDEDFVGILPRSDAPVAVETLLEASAVDRSAWMQVTAVCRELGLATANALFWYADASLALSPPVGSRYNGLQYIGLFEGD